MDKLLLKKPTALTPIFENIPNELVMLPNWVCWRYVKRENKWTKPPYTPANNNASTTDKATWSTFDQVKTAYLAGKCKFDGIGFVFDGDHSGIDFDHTINLDELIKEINSYAEYSPSGNGIHSITLGQIAVSGKRKDNIEIYSIGRFFTITGHKHPLSTDTLSELNGAVHKLYDSLSTSAPQVTQPQEAVSILLTDLQFQLARRQLDQARTSDHQLNAVWNGTAKYNSTSEAVLGLRTDLLRLTYGNQELADQLFKTSPLYAINPSKYDRTAQYEYPKAFERISQQLIRPTIIDQPPYLTEQQLGKLQLPTWLVQDEIAEHEITLLYAPSGTAKTFKAINTTLQVARTKPVMYIAAEDVHGVNIRIKAHRQYNNEQANGNVYIWPDALNLMNGEIDKFIIHTQQLNLALVVIDTLAMCIIGADENGPKDMGIAVGNIRKIQRALNCAILVVHHTGKDGTTPRGHSSLMAAAYMIFAMTETNNLYKIEHVKAKNSTKIPPKLYKLETVNDSAVLIDAQMFDRSGLTDVHYRVLVQLHLMGGSAKFSELLKALGINKMTLSRVKSRLLPAGLIAVTEDRQPWQISSKGTDLVTTYLQQHNGELPT